MTTEQRLFGMLERIFRPLSLLALVALVAAVTLRRCHVELPGWCTGWLLPIWLSAAVGYLTNWVAIEMLFKPYEKTRRHLFALLTLGYWQQGLVPKNKERIAEKIGEIVEQRLLTPETLADDLCQMVTSMLDDPGILLAIQNALLEQMPAHIPQLIEYVRPKLEQGMLSELDRIVTPENALRLWREQLEPYLEDEQVRACIAEHIGKTLNDNAPAIAERLQPVIQRAASEYLKTHLKGPLLAVAGPFANGIAQAILSCQNIEQAIRDWLNDEGTPDTLRQTTTAIVQNVRAFLTSPSGSPRIEQFVTRLRTTFREYLSSWLQTNLPTLTESLVKSPELWSAVRGFLRQFRPQMEEFIRTEGLPRILARLNISGRIREAVQRQDMRQFHQMVSEVTAQHLGAIQVLGFLLGALAGIFLAAAG